MSWFRNREGLYIHELGIFTRALFPCEACAGRFGGDSSPGFRGVLAKLQGFPGHPDKFRDLTREGFTRELKTIDPIDDRIFKASYRMDDAGLAPAHCQHLADAARLEEARHHKKRSAFVQCLPYRLRIPAQVEKSVILAVRSHQRIFVFRCSCSQKHIHTLML